MFHIRHAVISPAQEIFDAEYGTTARAFQRSTPRFATSYVPPDSATIRHSGAPYRRCLLFSCRITMLASHAARPLRSSARRLFRLSGTV